MLKMEVDDGKIVVELKGSLVDFEIDTIMALGGVYNAINGKSHESAERYLNFIKSGFFGELVEADAKADNQKELFGNMLLKICEKVFGDDDEDEHKQD